jgi:ABC-2 type transport system permease protein
VIANAISAEIFKLLRNRWSFLWAFAAMPAFALLSGLAEETITRAYVGDPLPYANPVFNAYMGLGSMQSSIFQIFAIVGAAILFAGEYRWETWRAILPRNARTSIMLAKLAVFAIAIAASIIACGLARFLVGLYDAGLTGEADWPPSPWLGLLIGFASAFLQVMVTAALVMLVSVVTRSMMAAIVATLVVLVALDIATIRIRLPDADLWVAALPNFASRSLSQLGMAEMGDIDAIGTHLAAPGAAAMLAWIVVLAGAALVLFHRQDLSRE